MDYISSNGIWPEQIYRLQVTDPIAGGEDGTSNIQPIQITNRTDYLKKVFLNEHNEDGTHNISNISIEPDAAIPESKLTLSVSTEDLNAALKSAQADLEEVRLAFSNAYGSDGKYVQGLLNQTNLMWKYSATPFAFELFHEGFTLRTIDTVEVTEAIANDDSIDIVTSNKYIKYDQSYIVFDNGLEVNAVVENRELDAYKDTLQKVTEGQELILWSTNDFTDAEEVQITDVLEEGRLRASANISKTYHAAKLGHTNWTLYDGYAIAQPKGIYISKLITTFENAPAGLVAVRRDVGNGQLDFYYRYEGSKTWTKLDRASASEYDEENMDYIYYLPSGRMYIKLINNSMYNVRVSSITCAQSMDNTYVRPILTPTLLGLTNGARVYRNQVKAHASRYSSAFRDSYKQTEYRIVSADTGATVMTMVRDANWNGTTAFEEVAEDKEKITTPSVYQVQCRHVSDMAYIGNCTEAGSEYGFSDWSDAVRITIMESRQYFAFLNYEPAEYGSGFFSVKAVDKDSQNFTLKPLTENTVPFGFYGVEGAAGFDEGFLE